MKKSNTAKKAPLENVCPEKLPGMHEHVHAANCGHKSYVHNGHVCYEHDGHFHYWHADHLHECEGPHARTGGRQVAAPAPTPGMGRDRLKMVKGSKK